MKAFRYVFVIALLAAAVPFVAVRAQDAPRYVTLAQGWSDEDRQAFWFTSQGSLLVPYRYFLNLEQADSETLFRDDGHFDRLRFLAERPSEKNPDGLPIGFTKDRRKLAGEAEPMLGLNCAACHTSRIQLGGKLYQIDGGPSMADFEMFLEELVAALEATGRQDAKFQRFAARLEVSGDALPALRVSLERHARRLSERVARNKPPHPAGYARVDALGNILNEVLATDLGIPENAKPPDAPVSYPVMWDAHAQHFVQWNGSAPNVGPGPLLRNIGEVLGVFGTLEFTPRRGRIPIYRNSSADVQQIKVLEDLATTLVSPLWPDDFPPIDQAKAKAGAAIFATRCQPCHGTIKRDDPKRSVQIHMVPLTTVKTDPRMATNMLARTAKTGPLQGTPVFVKPWQSFGATGSAADILRNAVFGVQVGQLELGVKEEGLKATPPPDLESAAPADYDAMETRVSSKVGAFMSLVFVPPQLKSPMYKARPLNGVWASAPYLHNGSVPTLRQMLTPPSQRVRTFYVGSRDYDPVDVGFKSVESQDGARHYLYDTSLDGNHNVGHPFGTSLSDADKDRLIEFLKTL